MNLRNLLLVRKLFFVEIILCALLIFTSFTLHYHGSKKVAVVGAFGHSAISNDTFEDLSENLLKELLS